MKYFIALLAAGLLTASGAAAADHDDWRRHAPYSNHAHDRHGHPSDFARRRGYGDRRDYGRRGHDRFARWYADTATAQARQNHFYGCREKGNAWTTDWYDHYRWALRARRDKAMREVEKRDHRLSRCGAYSWRW